MKLSRASGDASLRCLLGEVSYCSTMSLDLSLIGLESFFYTRISEAAVDWIWLDSLTPTLSLSRYGFEANILGLSLPLAMGYYC
jgi:hypothetical protein